MKSSIGVFTLCYDEIQAIHFAYQSFRLHHPDSPIYLNTESNLDYDFLHKYFDNIHIENVEDTQRKLISQESFIFPKKFGSKIKHNQIQSFYSHPFKDDIKTLSVMM